VFQSRADGGFFLGTAGELWCFEADGSARWRLTQFSAGFRQALPAFYRLAAGSEKGISHFYILDPLGNRILKFEEGVPAQGTLAAALQSSGDDRSRQNEIVRLCLERELYLQAGFFRRGDGEALVTDLGRRLESKQARLLAEAAEQLQNELRYGEAEAAYNRSLGLYRELRNLDPVDPRYPDAIRELSERRNALRQIRVADRRLSACFAEEVPVVRAGRPELGLALTNISGGTVEQVEVLARFSGFASRWQISADPIGPGNTLNLRIAMSESGSLNAEDLAVPCNLLVRYVQDRRTTTEHFRLPLVFPAGTLSLP
jgi:hypothetical protein